MTFLILCQYVSLLGLVELLSLLSFSSLFPCHYLSLSTKTAQCLTCSCPTRMTVACVSKVARLMSVLSFSALQNCHGYVSFPISHGKRVS
ncbi:hypothetical protein BDF20DRAFT_883916 [Mycotypha africana]|uniref:uncharacterized protein n=1 Tax=Mycotypha africana TaxID=64632 RepID=UPI0022FFC614|nr:uncharacterized protein BDF20DRAFT_883916 [Mycotypha africana]KAI8973754.1 hypothetical protein BDF20DRAFT_883916 [Mycotypha africana]